MYARRVRPLPTVLAAVALLFGSACQRLEDAPLKLRFASEEARLAALVIELRIASGSCSKMGDTHYTTRFFAQESGESPPALAAGRYAVWAEARTRACVPVAEGCLNLELPDSDAVEVTLAEIATPSFDAVSTDACEQWLDRRRVLPVPIPTTGGSPAPTVDAGDAGAVSSAVSGEEQPPAAGPDRCESQCPECPNSWRCCDLVGECGCTLTALVCNLILPAPDAPAPASCNEDGDCGSAGQCVMGSCQCQPLKASTCPPGSCTPLDDGCGGEVDCSGACGSGEQCVEGSCTAAICSGGTDPTGCPPCPLTTIACCKPDTSCGCSDLLVLGCS